MNEINFFNEMHAFDEYVSSPNIASKLSSLSERSDNAQEAALNVVLSLFQFSKTME